MWTSTRMCSTETSRPRLLWHAMGRHLSGPCVWNSATRGYSSRKRLNEITGHIRQQNDKYAGEWMHKASADIVQPGHFFRALQQRAAEDVIIVTDDGQHTFLTAELFPVNRPRHFISPTDFNCMGYCIPATIGAKLNIRTNR